MSWNIEKIMGHMQLAFKYVNEHGIETFLELAQADPPRAVKELPEYLGRVLSAGNDFFAGHMCGGPYPGVTGPLLNVVGIVYPALDRTDRETALTNCLRFLDNLNYMNAQNNVELISEPWLVADILINRWLYWCGYVEYSDKLKEMATWDDFEKQYFKEDRLHCKSAFLLAYAVAKPKYCNEVIRRNFCELFPDLVDRTKDGIAWIKHYCASVNSNVSETSYEKELREDLANIDPLWHEDIRERIKQGNWIVLPETMRRENYPIKNMK